MKKTFRALSLLGLLCLFMACNPKAETPQEEIEPPIICKTSSSFESNSCRPDWIPKLNPIQLLTIVCQRFYACTNLRSILLCQNTIAVQKGLSKIFDVTAETFDELELLYTHGRVLADFDRFQSCTQAINNLSCDSESLQSTIQITNTETDFQNVFLIFNISTDCGTVYSQEE